MPDQNWDDLRYLLAASRGGSFAAAARFLDVNESTVARRIEQAERRLQTRLFDRVSGRLTPTDPGIRLLAHAEAVEREVGAAMNAVAGQDLRVAGIVRITSVPIVVNRMLAPALPDLLSTHPALQIELVAEARDLSLSRREVDVALRLARPSGETRPIASRIGTLAYGLYGATDRDPDSLPYLTYEDLMRDLPQGKWLADQMKASGQDGVPVRVSDAETLVACIRSGLGKSLLPTAVADALPGLRRIGTNVTAPERELWLMIHPDMRGLARIEAVRDWIRDIVRSIDGRDS